MSWLDQWGVPQHWQYAITTYYWISVFVALWWIVARTTRPTTPFSCFLAAIVGGPIFTPFILLRLWKEHRAKAKAIEADQCR